MPGSFDSSAARSSIAPTLEREFEGEIQPACQSSHFCLREFAGFLLHLVDGNENQILEHLDILRIGNTRVDFHTGNGALAVGLDGDHAPTGCRRDGLLFQLGLHLLHARLHLLRLLEDLTEVCHWIAKRGWKSIEELEVELVDRYA